MASILIEGPSSPPRFTQAALAAVPQDVVLAENAPGGKVEYRRALAASFVFKFFVHAALKLEVRDGGRVLGNGRPTCTALGMSVCHFPTERGAEQMSPGATVPS